MSISSWVGIVPSVTFSFDRTIPPSVTLYVIGCVILRFTFVCVTLPPSRGSQAVEEMGVLLRRWLYYLRSIPVLLLGVRNWPQVVALFLGLPVRRPLTVTLRQSGLRFQVRSAMDVWVIKETCLDRDYERYGARLQRGWTVFDIGAALGDFTLFAAQQVGEQGRVYAFEPFPESFALLVDNIKLNGALNVTAYPYAVAGKRGHLRLVAASEAVRNATAPGSGPNEVEAWSLEEALDRVERCDLMKVDCEGGEYDIFLQAGAAALGKVQAICMEYHDGVTPYSHCDLVRSLEAHGFQVSVYPSRVQPAIGFLKAQRRAVERNHG